MSSSGRKVVVSPVEDASVLEELEVGDVFYITGVVVTARDEVHRRVVEEGLPPPVDLRGLAIFHAGPVMVRVGGEWQCLSVGPTTSMRMEYYEDAFIERTGVRVVIGKGGMGRRTAEACRRHKAVYAVFPGGCGVLGASRVVRVRGVEWAELGMPEAMWILEVRELGPLIVAIDTRGENLTERVLEGVRSAKSGVVAEIVRRMPLR